MLRLTLLLPSFADNPSGIENVGRRFVVKFQEGKIVFLVIAMKYSAFILLSLGAFYEIAALKVLSVAHAR